MDLQHGSFNCCICLRRDIKESNKCLSLFETYNNCSLLEKINSIADVKITEGDGLPNTICHNCLLQLNNAVSFRQKCQASNKKLLCSVNQCKGQKREKSYNKFIPVKEEIKIKISSSPLARFTSTIKKSTINCRICLRCDLKESNKCVSLFKSYNNCSIYEKINTIADVKIIEGDGLPNTICPNCLLQLNDAVYFKQKCEASNKILRCSVLLINPCKEQETENSNNESMPVEKEGAKIEIDNTNSEHYESENNYSGSVNNYSEPENNYSEPENNYSEPEYNYSEPEYNYSDPENNYSEPENREDNAKFPFSLLTPEMEQQNGTINCCICLQCDINESTKCLSLFSTSNSCLILDKINSIADVQITQGDGLPNTICHNCLLKLDSAVFFKTKCEASNKKLCGSVLLKNKYKGQCCRICLQCDIKESNKCLSLFKPYNNCSITEKINTIADVKIIEGDGLPNTICPNCIQQLNNTLSFKQKCEASNKILRFSFLLNNHRKGQERENSNNEPIPVNEKETKIEIILEQCSDHSESEKREDNKKGNYIANPNKPLQKRKVLKLICDDCGSSFKSKCKMRVHWMKVHIPEKLSCPKCKRKFRNYKSFKIHRDKNMCMPATMLHVEGQGKSCVYHCKECNYQAKELYIIERHLAKHTGQRKLQCKSCPKTFSAYASLRAHREYRHQEYRLEKLCDVCGKYIQGQAKYRQHIAMHKATIVQCKLCHKNLKKYCIAAHMLKHTSRVKSYSCEICAASFFTNSGLYSHKQKVHFKSRDFKCDLCDYKVSTKGLLKLHRSKHTDTNIICLVCGKFSKNTEKYALHQKRHFEKNMPCPECDQFFHNKKNLNNHVNKVHRRNITESHYRKMLRKRKKTACESSLSQEIKNL